MFLISLEPKSTMTSSELDLSNIELDSVISMVITLCDVLGDADNCIFSVQGFGDEKWPVDVSFDLSCVLQQINPILSAVNDGLNFDLDFYEQGIERRLNFFKEGGFYDISCISATDWLPANGERISIEELRDQFVELKSSFAELAQEIIPRLKSNGLFLSWLNGTTENRGR